MRKIKLTNNKLRGILSDTLPYELPSSFSNSGLYSFLNKLDLKIEHGTSISWEHIDSTHDYVLCLIFGIDRNNILLVENNRKKILLANCQLNTIPVTYQIKKDINDLRALSLIHPRNQIMVSQFYEQYAHLILYYCNLDSFSIRKPIAIAKSVYHKDEVTELGSIEHIIEDYKNNSDVLKSYFVYDSSYIYEFFESTTHHRCEKQYNQMIRVDVSKCFDSLYTHSIAWAVLGKNVTKNIFSNVLDGTLKGSFVDDFDKLMQNSNYQETNGIPIGAEISRIFAEIIMQHIDRETKKLLSENKMNYGKDYEIFRYVDDYFIFCNDNNAYQQIIHALQINLATFKLGINFKKEVIYQKPIVTEQTIAKKRIAALLEEKLKYNLQQISPESEEIKGNIYVDATSLIADFKIILKITNVSYEDVLNYTFAIIEKKIQKILQDYSDPLIVTPNPDNIISGLSSILTFLFFIYSVSPKVNITIKLVSILQKIIAFCKNTSTIDVANANYIYDQIYQDCKLTLERNALNKYTQIETLYLLNIMAQLGKTYRLTENELAEYLGYELNAHKRFYKSKDLNYFSLTTSMLYMKDIKRYKKLRNRIIHDLLDKLEDHKSILHIHTESMLLFLDLLACPYVDNRAKYKACRLFGINDLKELKVIVSVHTYWFTKWHNFNLADELDKKRSLEVY